MKVELTKQELFTIEYLLRCEKLSLERSYSTRVYRRQINELYKKINDILENSNDKGWKNTNNNTDIFNLITLNTTSNSRNSRIIEINNNMDCRD